MTVEIRPLRDGDMAVLAARLRPMDRLEVSCLAPGRDVREVVESAPQGSFRNRAAFFDGDLVACWGVGARTALSAQGTPWLLATDAMDRAEVRRAFIRHGREEMASLIGGFTLLWNFVHEHNRVAIRWLRHMGFEFPGVARSFDGEWFLLFRMEI